MMIIVRISNSPDRDAVIGRGSPGKPRSFLFPTPRGGSYPGFPLDAPRAGSRGRTEESVFTLSVWGWLVCRVTT